VTDDDDPTTVALAALQRAKQQIQDAPARVEAGIPPTGLPVIHTKVLDVCDVLNRVERLSRPPGRPPAPSRAEAVRAWAAKQREGGP